LYVFEVFCGKAELWAVNGIVHLEVDLVLEEVGGTDIVCVCTEEVFPCDEHTGVMVLILVGYGAVDTLLNARYYLFLLSDGVQSHGNAWLSDFRGACCVEGQPIVQVLCFPDKCAARQKPVFIAGVRHVGVITATWVRFYRMSDEVYVDNGLDRAADAVPILVIEAKFDKVFVVILFIYNWL
jgi:hypothetical protein